MHAPMVDDIVRANSGAAASVPDMMARFSWASREARQVRFAPDSPLEEGGFELSVPRHGEVTAALRYAISGRVRGTGSGAT